VTGSFQARTDPCASLPELGDASLYRYVPAVIANRADEAMWKAISWWFAADIVIGLSLGFSSVRPPAGSRVSTIVTSGPRGTLLLRKHCIDLRDCSVKANRCPATLLASTGEGDRRSSDEQELESEREVVDEVVDLRPKKMKQTIRLGNRVRQCCQLLAATTIAILLVTTAVRIWPIVCEAAQRFGVLWREVGRFLTVWSWEYHDKFGTPPPGGTTTNPKFPESLRNLPRKYHQ
jgi:hypothetical protein